MKNLAETDKKSNQPGGLAEPSQRQELRVCCGLGEAVVFHQAEYLLGIASSTLNLPILSQASVVGW